jgi:hypothetical protein
MYLTKPPCWINTREDNYDYRAFVPNLKQQSHSAQLLQLFRCFDSCQEKKHKNNQSRQTSGRSYFIPITAIVMVSGLALDKETRLNLTRQIGIDGW